MRLTIKISRLSNFLFFIKKTTKYSSMNIDLHKYFLYETLELSFYAQNNTRIWNQIRKIIGKKNIEEFKKFIASFSFDFNSYWNKSFKNLVLWRRYFQNNEFLFRQTLLKIEKLSGIKHFLVSKVPIYFVSDPTKDDEEINAWFSWTPSQKSIVIEIPFGYKPPNNYFPLSILEHEFFHLILRKNKKLLFQINNIVKENDKLLRKISNGMSNRMVFEELLVSSFIPEGYLNEKYFNQKVTPFTYKPKDLLEWRKFVAYKFYKTSKRYVDDNIVIDENYLKDLIELVGQNIKNPL